jgi:hypothetical protein
MGISKYQFVKITQASFSGKIKTGDKEDEIEV